LEQAQKLDPDSPETLLAFAFYQAVVLNDYEAAQTAAARVNEMLPRSSEAVRILALVAKYAGRWDESVSYYERALSLDPRNVDLLTVAAWTYIALRQFPQALKLLDRVLDITPNEFGAMASKIRVYQAQGNLEEAAKLISVCEQVFPSRVSGDWLQLRLERKYGEAIQWLQAQLAQSQPDEDKADMLLTLALTQHLTGATASAKVTAEQTRDILERLYRDNPEEPGRASQLSWDYALMGKRDLALNLAEHTVMLKPRAKDPVGGPGWEVELAGIQTLVGNNSEAISTLTKLLQTPFSGGSFIQGPPITPAVLRLDPIWDPLRGDPAFQKLCQDKLDRSIAVLPFENLSGDPNNAYFADGIQEEILTRLAKIADLKVISRTSTQRYHSKPGNLAEIAKQLGVANILEGSIQKAADQVRVNVQLINALSDSHVWADTYDRKLTDIFGVESEIAKGIAESLQARLTGREEQALAVKPTTNPEAYDAYLRGLSLDTRNYGTSYSQDLEIKAAASYERAVQLDPKFAFAWARLSYADAQIYNSDSNVDRGEAAKHAAEQALKLAPNSPEVLIPFGSYQTSMLRDFEGAKATWERAHKMLPGNSEALSGLGAASRWEGHWDESFSYYEQALTLDPRNVRILMNAAYTYTIARRFPAALKLYDRVLDITPDDLGVKATKASIYQAQGNLAEAARLLSGIDEHTPNEAIFGKKATQLQLERNYGELARLLQARLTQFHYSELDKAGYQSWLAFAQVWGGDTAGGRANAEQACNTLQQFYRDHPDDGNPNVAGLGVPIGLSEAYALLGEKDLALKLAEHIVTRKWRFPLNPVEAPGLKEYLATIQAIVGENSSAISTFTELLQTPYTSFMNGPIPITPASLRLDPTLDPLRSDPRFQKLCQEK
jgi:TolB-like protein/Tfp pilus assembly protein PilF